MSNIVKIKRIGTGFDPEKFTDEQNHMFSHLIEKFEENEKTFQVPADNQYMMSADGDDWPFHPGLVFFRYPDADIICVSTIIDYNELCIENGHPTLENCKCKFCIAN